MRLYLLEVLCCHNVALALDSMCLRQCLRGHATTCRTHVASAPHPSQFLAQLQAAYRLDRIASAYIPRDCKGSVVNRLLVSEEEAAG